MTENTDINANFLNADWWETATVEDVEAEIAKGADVNAEDKDGWNSMFYAAWNNKNPKILKVLEEYASLNDITESFD